VDFDRRRPLRSTGGAREGGDDPDAARWLATLREPPSMLRDLIIPGIIAGCPCCWCSSNPILAAPSCSWRSCSWCCSGPEQNLAVGARASPVIGLVLAFSTVAWASGSPYWPRCCSGGDPTLGGAPIMGLNVLGGVLALPFWNRLAPYQQNRLLAFLNPDVDPRRRVARHPIEGRGRVGRTAGQGVHGRDAEAARVSARAAHRFHLLVVGEELEIIGVLSRYACSPGCSSVCCASPAARRIRSRACASLVRRPPFYAYRRERGHDDQPDAITGIPLPFFSLRWIVPLGVLGWRRDCAARRVESRQSGYARTGAIA